MCENKNDCGCISEILSIINILQQNAECGDFCLDSCDRGFLGCNISNTNCNTRPVMIYSNGGNGTALSMPISKDPNETTTSNIFRIEKIDGCCATFRVLILNTDVTSQFTYESTNSFFTINLNCLCIIRCLQDTYIENI